jgi:SpoVK/Ycf46/Vps4 family AAA+-type ATPase
VANQGAATARRTESKRGKAAGTNRTPFESAAGKGETRGKTKRYKEGYEFEALAPVRDTLGRHNQYKAEEVNEFLARMGTCSEKGVLLIAASNAPWKIDPAVQRSGRLDKKIHVGPPDQTARGEILVHHLRGRYTTPDLRTEVIAKTLTGYSSSDLKLLVDEAANLAVKSNEAIGEKHLNSARGLVPPSVLPRIEAQHEHFKARCGNTFAVATAVGFRCEQ